MAQLKFQIKGQTIRRIDGFKVVAKSINYLYAQFEFSDDWGSGTKTAQFKSDQEEKPREKILDENGCCKVPWEVLQYNDSVFSVSVFSGSRITTNSAAVEVGETGYSEDGESSQEPTPGVYEQILERMKNIEQMEAVAETLPAGSEATAEYNNGTMTLGIPEGPQGDPGTSPTITVTDITNGHRVTITDADGTKTFDVMNGAQGDPGAKGDPGADGVSPTVTVTEITGGHRVVITDASGEHTFDVMNGEGGSTITVDSAMSSTSENPVQNKVINAELTDVKEDLNQLSESIAPVESTTTATAAHAVGELFMVGETLMVALSAIAIGDTIVTDGASPNAAVTTVSDKMIKDVQINGTSVATDGVANIPLASNNNYGVATFSSGLSVYGGTVAVNIATDNIIKGSASATHLIPVSKQHLSTFYGLARVAGDNTQRTSSNPVGTYTEAAKSAISDMFNAPVSVSGTTPTINAMSGVRYVCGEVSTLDVVAPESGCIDVVFTSGSTPTVLTVTSAKTGVTAIKWANGFDPSSLEANATYEINILDGEYGVAGLWM